MQRPCFLVTIRRVEFIEDGNLQLWHHTKVESFENICLGPVGHQIPASKLSAVALDREDRRANLWT